MSIYLLDLVLLLSVLCFVFGIGSAFLIFGRHDRSGLAHPWQWFTTTYTLRRWLTNPLKMSIIGMVWQTNFQQLALTGPVSSLAGDLDYGPRLYLVLANLLGASVCFYALHLRDFELSLWVEASSYIALIGTLGIWIALVYLTVPLPNTSYGLNLTEAVVIGSVIRLPIIMRYKHVLRDGDARKTARWRLTLGGDLGG